MNRSRPGEYDPSALTPRETEVLRLVGQGMSNEEIAERMGIAPNTVRTHVKRVHDKLYIVGRARLAVEAYKRFEKEDNDGIPERVCRGDG